MTIKSYFGQQNPPSKATQAVPVRVCAPPVQALLNLSTQEEHTHWLSHFQHVFSVIPSDPSQWWWKLADTNQFLNNSSVSSHLLKFITQLQGVCYNAALISGVKKISACNCWKSGLYWHLSELVEPEHHHRGTDTVPISRSPLRQQTLLQYPKMHLWGCLQALHVQSQHPQADRVLQERQETTGSGSYQTGSAHAFKFSFN